MTTTPSPIVLILRFRDLHPPIPGFTIEEHSKIIQQHGDAWWAWWKKQSEEIPVQLWSDVSKEIRANGKARAFLLDSGQRLLYETTLLELHFAPSGEPKTAPEGGAKTPVYYNPPNNPSAFATWFKIGPITKVPEDTLSSLMYRQVPHDDLAAADPEDFVGKRVAGIAQLLEFGNITYWVASPTTPDARPAARAPRYRKSFSPIAPKEIVRAESMRILHISDLHFAEGKHAFAVRNADAHNLSLADSLYQTLKNEERLPGLVVVTGDLTWSGASEEFEAAFDCLDALRSMLGITRQHFVIVPGNHDLQWTKAQTERRDYEWDGKVEIATMDARRNYESFFERWYETTWDKWLAVGRRFFLVGGPTVDILGLNSSALQQVENVFAGIGRITEQAFDESAGAMGWKYSDRMGPQDARATALRMLAIHHHLLPVVAKESPEAVSRGFGIALDAGNQLVRATRYAVDLVLHGHQHHPYVGFTHREEVFGAALRAKGGLLILGAGSASVVDKYLGPIGQRCFNLVHLGFTEIRAELFAAADAHDQFKLVSSVHAVPGQPWQRRNG